MPDTPPERPSPSLRVDELASAHRGVLENLLTRASRAIAAVDELHEAHWRAVVAGELHAEAEARLEQYLETEAHRGNTDEHGELSAEAAEAERRAREAVELRNAAFRRGGQLFDREVQVQAVWDDLIVFLREWNARRAAGVTEPATAELPVAELGAWIDALRAGGEATKWGENPDGATDALQADVDGASGLFMRRVFQVAGAPPHLVDAFALVEG